MIKAQIKEGVTYRTKTGNAARKVLRIGVASPDMERPRWYGSNDRKPPSDALLVEFEQVRGPGIGRREIVFLDNFAVWAACEDGNTNDGVRSDLVTALHAILESDDLAAIHRLASDAIERAKASV